MPDPEKRRITLEELEKDVHFRFEDQVIVQEATPRVPSSDQVDDQAWLLRQAGSGG